MYTKKTNQESKKVHHGSNVKFFRDLKRKHPVTPVFADTKNPLTFVGKKPICGQ